MDASLVDMGVTFWTIGHSIRTLEEFVTLLAAHHVRCLVDVRRFPGSRRVPHFNQEPLKAGLEHAGLSYRSIPSLGGRRPTRAGSLNGGWKNASFRGYADYMQSTEFDAALGELLDIGQVLPTAIMCAEAVPWRCHRSLIADALIVRGCEVRHILSVSRWDSHHLTSFARFEAGRLTYPASEAPSLF